MCGKPSWLPAHQRFTQSRSVSFVSPQLRIWSKDEAPSNIRSVLQSDPSLQSFSGWLNDEAPWNIDCIPSTLLTRHSASAWLNDEA